MQKHRVFSWEVTASNANMCETSISVFVCVGSISNLWKSRCWKVSHPLGQQIQDPVCCFIALEQSGSPGWDALLQAWLLRCMWFPGLQQQWLWWDKDGIESCSQRFGIHLKAFTSDRDLAVKYLRRVCGTGNVYFCQQCSWSSATLQRGRGQKVVFSHSSQGYGVVVIIWNLDIPWQVFPWIKCFLKCICSIFNIT